MLKSNKKRAIYVVLAIISLLAIKGNDVHAQDENSNVVSNSTAIDLCFKLLDLGYSINIIESVPVIKEMSSSFNESYPNKVKFYKQGLKPEGCLIKF